MTARYRLPEVLGGGEYEGEYFWSGCAGATPEYRLTVPGVGWVTVASKEPLTEVKPELPEEPPPGAVVRAGEYVYERGAGNVWFQPGTNESYRWSDLCSYANHHAAEWPGHVGTPVRLVPDPAVGVELPWRLPMPHGGGAINVSLADVLEAGRGVALVSTPGPYILDAANARAMAAALLAAADAADGEVAPDAP